MRLRTRLFVAFSLFSAVLLVALALLFQLGFERGLDRYLGQRMEQELAQLAGEFADFFETRGSFRGVRMRMLVRGHEGGFDEPPIPPGLGLIEADGRQLFGPALAEDNRIQVPIRVGEDTVGWLTLPASDPLRQRLEKRFQHRQLRTLVMSLVPALILSLLAAWLISRQLGRPIEATVRFTRQLSQGDYHQRLAIGRNDEIGQLGQQLDQLAYTLERAGAARERWLTDISHELRTPVAVLRGEVEALVDGIRPADAANLGALQDHIRHLSCLLDDLHDLALADAGTLRYQMAPCDLADLLRESCQALTLRAGEAGHQLTLDSVPEQAPLQGDATRLRQLLVNLLENAIKHTDAPGTIRVRLQRETGHWQVTIDDSAPGVSDEELARLFDPLFRTRHARQRPGAGLGLAISQRIARAHGGELHAGHSDSGGLSMTLRLPATGGSPA